MEKYCMHCGGKIEEGEKFCQNCGASTEDAKTEVVNNLEQNTVQSNTIDNMQNNINANMPKKTNGLAIASLVCSLVGLIIFGVILGILAISFGVTAKKRMEVFNNEGGKGLATAGIIIGIIDIPLAILAAIINALL